MKQTIIGAYGAWVAELGAGKLPELSFRRGELEDVDAWRGPARRRVLERLAAPEVAAPGQIETLEARDHDGLTAERLRWQLPYGPATEAVLLKPAGHSGPLPGVLGLHCHSGKKYFGKRKIARWGRPHPLMLQLQQHQYGGRAWANELARRGYVVLVHDGFGFGSRRVRLADCTEAVRGDLANPADDHHQAIAAYDRWAAEHETILAQALFVAGTTWPGAAWAEDRAALDILAARGEVDATRLGCAGLSGGGCRTVFLAGLDQRIRCAVCAGYMTTWRGLMLDVPRRRAWIGIVPRLPAELDFPEILTLRAPAASMVLNCRQDPLFALQSMQAAEGILQEVFAKAGGSDRLRVNYYDGGHRFDVLMQEDAFDWFDRWLKG
jgi:dienelactone hydrolase